MEDRQQGFGQIQVKMNACLYFGVGDTKTITFKLKLIVARVNIYFVTNEMVIGWMPEALAIIICFKNYKHFRQYEV